MAERIVLRAGQLFDGTGAPARHNLYVTVEGERIVSVGPEQPAEGSAEVIDAPDATVLPGLIDCHVHLTLSGSPRWLEEGTEPLPFMAWKAARFAQETLEAGFTTVRDLGSHAQLSIHLRDAIERGLLRGPRILAAGYAICMTGGHGRWIGREADGADEVRKAVREQLRAGADAIKFIATGGVMTPGVEPGSAQLGLDELRAGIEEAHKAGKVAAAHAQGGAGIRNAVEAGIDSIEHGFYMEEGLVELMRERGTYFVPTLAAAEGIVVHGVEGGIPDWAVRKCGAAQEAHQHSFSMALRAGVPIALGTDAGTPFNFHGRNARELTLLVQSGMGAEQALLAGTSVAASLLRLDHEIGTIESGKQADLVLAQGDPLADISILERPENILAVFKAGRRVAGRLG